MDYVISSFVRKHIDLLRSERDENLQHVFNNISAQALRNLEKEGDALTKLSVGSLASRGLKQLQIDFVDPNNLPLKHAFAVGDLVACIQSNNRSQFLPGLVSAISQRTISVTISDQTVVNVNEEEQFAIIKADSDYTYNCQTRALKNLESTETYSWRCFNVIRILFDNDEKIVQELIDMDNEISEKYLNVDGQLKFINDKLAEDQRMAVSFALRKKFLAIIQGPPGTGKTTTLVELIGQLRGLGKKVLVCAPTNVAVDNIAQKLCDAGIKPLRMGHPARIAKEVQSCSIDANVRQDNSYEILVQIKQSLKELQEKDGDTEKGGKPWGKIKELSKEYRERMDKLTSEIIRRHPVILCTLNSATTGKRAKTMRHVPREYFDVVVVDEASQALEASNWIAIPNAEKVVLAGDINQLPPAVMNQKAAKNGLCVSLMERAIKKLGKKAYKSLEIQYRMNSKIMSWSSKQFYENTLKADKLVANHLLRDLPGVESCSLTSDSLVFIDTCGCECEEYQIGSGTISKGNVGEAIVVDRLVAALVKSGVPEREIGVITPYALQVDFVRKTLSTRSISAEVSTVDGFQGREKEVIVLSLVRSNEEKSLGFVTDFRRLNVAVTRARRLLVVIVNSETVEDNKLITGLLKHIEDNGLLQTAQEYLEDNSEDLKKDLEENVKVKQKSVVTNKTDSKTEKRKKPASKNGDKIKGDTNLKSVLKDKGIDLSINANRKDYNLFECISESNSDIEDTELLPNTVEIATEDPEETDEALPSVEQVESKPKIELSNLIASLKQLETTSTQVSSAGTPLASNQPVPMQAKKNKKSKNRKPKNSEITADDDLDKLIATVTANDYICAMAGCKKSTQLMHVDCEFCKSRFCFTHGMQEIHGCGEAVRNKERKEFVRRKPENCKKTDKDKFARKLKQLEEARKPKKKVEK
ncbi:DNA-binding protein SMUBP-2-like isoform X1 [Neodiprion virginianus]|uniref:DNA-binding protein SMUBP-2-like isoform X1 n=1 Tax=Neodiprion virginianus TaxID=2961670 RepID=UPI001EE6DB8C|nr:DNA-binding protein SMUBP-2-like isoform X1 [Neodiprion virginianus]